MTDKLRAAAQAALHILDDLNRDYERESWRGCFDAEVSALRAALAEQGVEQEPVAITTKAQIEEMQHGYSRAIVGKDPKFWLVKRADDVPLYAAPPSREWVSLTDEDIEAAWKACDPKRLLPSFASAVEAALKEKNT